jgi:hypothetical protein
LEFHQLGANARAGADGLGRGAGGDLHPKVACVTLWENTKRAKTVDVGANILTEANSEEMLKGTKRMLSQGDDKTSNLIPRFCA